MPLSGSFAREFISDCDYDCYVHDFTQSTAPAEDMVLPYTPERLFLYVAYIGVVIPARPFWSIGGKRGAGLTFVANNAIPFTSTVNSWYISCDEYGEIVKGEVWIGVDGPSGKTVLIVESRCREICP